MTDVLKEGQELKVQVADVDNRGRITHAYSIMLPHVKMTQPPKKLQSFIKFFT